MGKKISTLQLFELHVIMGRRESSPNLLRKFQSFFFVVVVVYNEKKGEKNHRFPVKSFEFNGPPKKLLRLSDGERADLTSALAQANTRKSLSQTIELSRNMSLRYVPTITHDPKERPPLASPKELNGWYIYDWANGAFFYSVSSCPFFFSCKFYNPPQKIFFT